MELLYIWIEDYKNIKEQGFNFSPKWRFDYNQEDGTVKIDDRRNEGFKDFFGKNISNITAIVGKNGSGKSSLLEFIFSNIHDGNYLYNRWNESMVLIYLENDGKIKILYHKKLKEPKYREDTIELDIFSFPADRDNDFRPLDQMQFILYDDLFDSVMPHEGSYNLTTSGLIDRALQNYTFKKDKNEYSNFLISYQTLEFQRQIKFAIDFMKDDNIPFKLPHSVLITLFDSPKLQTSYVENLSFDIQGELDKFYEKHLKKTFVNQLRWTMFIGAIDFTVGSNTKVVIEPLRQIIVDFNDGEFFFVKWIEMLVASHNTFEAIFKRSNFFDIVNFFEDYFENTSPIFIKVNDSLDSVRITSNNWGILSNMIDNYSVLTNHIFRHFLTFRWFELSAGEKAYLKLFSRFYILVEKSHYYNYCVLIDEGSSHYHPQWQKEYLQNLIKILPKVLYEKDHKITNKIQLIFSSHSPFALSDLPKNHIIFLDADKDGYCKLMSGLNEQKQTFGANIHTLFTDSFFMDGLIGNFAQQKINDVILFLDDTSHSPIQNMEEAEKIVQLIGEPIVRNYLQKRIDSKRLKKVDSNEAKIKWLEEELNKLKNGNQK